MLTIIAFILKNNLCDFMLQITYLLNKNLKITPKVFNNNNCSIVKFCKYWEKNILFITLFLMMSQRK